MTATPAGGALHQMRSGLDEEQQRAAWTEIEQALGEFETNGRFIGSCELEDFLKKSGPCDVGAGMSLQQLRQSI